MEDQRIGRHSTLMRISCQRGWAEIRSYTLSPPYFSSDDDDDVRTYRSPTLSSSMGRKLHPAPPPSRRVPEGEVERGCRRMCWVIILSNIPHTQLSNPPRCRRAYLNEARRSSEGRGQRVLNDL
jgi:hypothetical protein